MFKSFKKNLIQANAVIYKTFFADIVFNQWDFNLRNKEAVDQKAAEIYVLIAVSAVRLREPFDGCLEFRIRPKGQSL